MRWNLKRTLAMILCFICVFFAVYKPIPVRAEGIIDQMVYYALSVSGYMKKNLIIDGVNGGGGGHQYGKPISSGDKNKNGNYILSTLRDAFQNAYENHHITQDQSGNITFDSTVTKNFYDIVEGTSNGLGGYNALVFDENSDFFNFRDNYVNNEFRQEIYNLLDEYPQYFALSGYAISSYREHAVTYVIVFDKSQFDCVSIGSNANGSGAQNVYFLKNGSYVNVDYKYVTCSYSEKTGSNGVGGTTTGQGQKNTASGITMSVLPSGAVNVWGGSYDTKGMYYSGFPHAQQVWVADGGSAINNLDYWWWQEAMANTPTVVGDGLTNTLGAYAYLNNRDYVNVTTYNVFPSVTNEQITNNNFQQTYNKYVDNVNTVYNTTYNDEDDFDFNAFQQIMKDQNTVVLNAINQGIVDVTGSIQTTNDKLDIIIGLLEILQNTINGGDGGGSSDTQSAVYLQQILQYINSNPWNTSPPNIVINNTAPNVVVNNTAPNVVVNVESDTMSAVLLREIYDYIIANPWAQSGSNVTTPEIEIPATGSAVNVMSVSSAYLYANADNSGGWSMGRNTGTPTYYQIFKMDNVKSFKLTTTGGTRTRVMFTDYEPETFYDNLEQRSAFTVTGNYSANLSDSVTEYLLQNSSGSEYFYVYTGNAQAQVDITDIELKQATITVGGGGSGGGFTSLQAYEVIDLLRFLVNNQVTFSEFQTIMQNVLSYLSQLASSNSATYNEISEINDTLVDIYNAIVSNGNSNNPENNNYYYGDNYYTNNKNKINNDLQNYIDQLYDDYHFPDDPEPIVDAMTQVVPWCFLVMVTTLFSELATEPETPYFEIPFVIESLNYEYTVVIDFSEYDTIHDILIAGEMILFIICCIYVYFYLFKIIYDVF